MWGDKGADIFNIDSMSSEEKNQMGYTLFFISFLAVSIFFFLPAVLIAILVTIFLKKKIPVRFEKIIFLISLVLFVLYLFNNGIIPLLQFGIIWKGIAPNIVKWFELMIQNSTAFHITSKSWISLILCMICMSSLFLLLYRRLQKTWFTHEKEADKTNYFESDEFRKFFKQRGAILNKRQAEYRKSKNKKIYIGMNIHKENVFQDIKSFFTHCLIQGTTGSGKTTLMYSIAEGALREGLGGVFIDGKGDPKTEMEIQKLVNHYKKKLYVFSDRSTLHYNPVRYGKVTAIKDRLMAVMDWSESFYEKESENMLQMIIGFIQSYIEIENQRTDEERAAEQGERLKMDLTTIHRFLDLEEIALYLFYEQSSYIINQAAQMKNETSGEKLIEQVYMSKSAGNNNLHTKYIQYFFKKKELNYGDLEMISEMKGETVKLIRGLRTQIELLIYSDLGDKFIEDENEAENLDMYQAIKEGNIVLFSFNSNDYSDFIKSIGRFVISDIAHIVTKLYSETDDFLGAMGWFDEFGSYANEKIVDILSKARAAKFAAILGIQSISDMVTETQDLTEKIIDNINLFFLGRSNYFMNAEKASNTAGTYADIDRTVMTENRAGALARIETKAERGTVRNVRKYWFGPDEVKDMPNYTFLMIDKTKDTLEPPKEQVFIRNTINGL